MSSDLDSDDKLQQSGIYNRHSNTTRDFEEKLKGDVVVSGKWGTFNSEDNGGAKAADETLDMPSSFDDSINDMSLSGIQPLSEQIPFTDDGADADESIEFNLQPEPSESTEQRRSSFTAESSPSSTGGGMGFGGRGATGRVLSTEGVTGVGFGGMFSKFAGWTRPVNRLSPRSAAAAPAATTDDDDNNAVLKQETKRESSVSTASASPLKTESMRSQSNLSNLETTPSRTGSSPYSTPRGRRSRHGSVSAGSSASRNVNPLARHLAIKAVRNSVDENSPIPAGRKGAILSPLSPSIDHGSAAGAETSMMLNLSEIQKQFDGFASLLKHDASAVQADLRESEETWGKMQRELHQLRTQLLDAETTRDFYQRQMDAAERDRMEWEEERQQLMDDNQELLENLDHWRQRIGDAENERQGVWQEGSNTRKELLETIAQLEDELAKSRKDFHQAKFDMASEWRQKELEWQAEKRESANHLEHVLAELDQVDVHNRQMQAELHDAMSKCIRAEQAAQNHEKQATNSQQQIEELRKELESIEKHALVIERREAQATAEAEGLRHSNDLLKETLENLTEQNRDLKEKHQRLYEASSAIPVGQSSNFTQTRNKAVMVDNVVNNSSEIARIKSEHHNELEHIKNDHELLVQSLKELQESKELLKQENRDFNQRADDARVEIESLRRQLSLSKSNNNNNNDLEMKRLQRELDDVERSKDQLSSRLRIMEDRNNLLSDRNDQLLQRTARLETELGDLTDKANNDDEVAMLQDEVSTLQKMIEEMELGLRMKDEDNDKLRQATAQKDVKFDDMQMELERVRENLAIEQSRVTELQRSNVQLNDKLAGIQNKVATTETGTKTSPSLDPPSTVRNLNSEVSELGRNISQMRERRDKLQKEQRFLAEQLRDTLLRNATLRMELTDILLRRAGKVRELQTLQRAANGGVGGDQSLLSEDGNNSTMANNINNVPSTSQLLDDAAGSSYLRKLDSHLDEMVNIIDEDENMQHSPVLRRSNSQPTKTPMRNINSNQRKILTPIKEDFSGVHSVPLRDAQVQCGGGSDGNGGMGDITEMRGKVYKLEEECRSLRTSIAYVKQERDQFRASQEEAVERVSHLTGQIEELSEGHERMKTISVTTVRVSLRVNRQLRVLKRALARMSPRNDQSSQSAAAGGGGGEGATSMFAHDSLAEIEEKEDIMAMEEDDDMLNATIDRPLEDEEDLGQFGISKDGAGVENDQILDQIGINISEAYAEVKRVRRDIMRIRRERARLMKRLVDMEKTKLPSYELSTQWGRNMRARSQTESSGTAAARMADLFGNGNGNDDDLLGDMEPPASLFLPDESAVLAEIRTLKRTEMENGDDDIGSGSQLPLSPIILNMEALKDPVAAATEISRLAMSLKKRTRRLKMLEADSNKLEEFNRDLVQKLDRAYSEKLRIQQECNAMSLRASTRTASRTSTPKKATDWDSLDAVKRELEKCTLKNRDYFDNVETLCKILNQHTLDCTLADYKEDNFGTAKPASASSGPPNPPENVYRTLLMDMATVLDSKSDLDDKKSIRENFSSLATAVRHRLDEKDRQLERLHADLDVSRLASEAAASANTANNNNNAPAEKAMGTVSGSEARVRKAERRAAELEVQVTEVQEQLTTYQTNIRSLNENISRLRQQCVAADADLQEARLERDGWHQQHLATEHALNYQLEENERMKKALKKLDQLRSRNTQEFVMNEGLVVPANGSNDWEMLKDEWTVAVREETIEAWRDREFVLRQTYEAQVNIFSWVNSLWSDIVYGIVSHTMQPGAVDMAVAAQESSSNSNSQQQKSSTSSNVNGKTLSAKVQKAVDNLNAGVETAIKRANELQESAVNSGDAQGGGDDVDRASFVESLNQVIQNLGRDFAGAWRDNVRGCLISLISVGMRNSSGLNQVASISPTTTLSSASTNSSSGYPKLTSEQKKMIREHYGKREDKLKQEFKRRQQLERDETMAREASVKADFNKEKAVYIEECKYLRGRIQNEVNRLTFVNYQKRVLMQLLGDHDGVMERIDMLVARQEQRQSQGEVIGRRIRSLWRRPLLIIRLRNRLEEIWERKHEVDAIKDRALRSSQSTGVRSDRSPENNGRRFGYNYQPQHQYRPKNYSKPITPSGLRNRGSELLSSPGSSELY